MRKLGIASMRKLKEPSISFSECLQACLSGIAVENDRNLFSGLLLAADGLDAAYKEAAKDGKLVTFSRVKHRKGYDPQVFGELKKSDLVHLYTQNLVPQGKPGRAIYDRIKVTSNGKCPFCGDIGHVKSLDHYVPKANFPIYSVTPANLVPCCRDCNSEKLNSFPVLKSELTLHPYYDDDRFFEVRWVSARVVEADLPVVEFYVDAPKSWSQEDRERVLNHFGAYNLAERFSVEAAVDVVELIRSRRGFLRNFSAEDFSSYLKDRSSNSTLPINNWRRVSSLALSNSEWFCKKGQW
jgi:hypothetical protein